ncbi:hypothetical protein [Wolbachia endosymbiont of Litomosoides brasiliensis]|uniref:hypothetical protein n=1 Tax=Wolbachia endosymbiont of Litomosoides brasiliensis TaxID=1812117 RepID=UPI00158CFC9C|nr:hypothetical protein [Wolbachia endosymbiont of Litomosoides brasiliensis]
MNKIKVYRRRVKKLNEALLVSILANNKSYFSLMNQFNTFESWIRVVLEGR